MLSLGRARAKVVGMLSGSSGYATAPTSTITSIINFWQQEQSFETRRLIRRYLIITLIVIWTVKLWFAPMALALASAQPFMMSQTTNIQQAYPEFSALDYHTTTQLPYIPPKVHSFALRIRSTTLTFCTDMADIPRFLGRRSIQIHELDRKMDPEIALIPIHSP